jgi:glycosyltransferase involved in cell wall biosynthesis
MNILFLYSKLAGYTVECLNTYAKENNDNNIFVIKYPVHAEAPFEFEFEKNIIVVDKSTIDLDDYIKSINPNLIISSGWFNKEYLKIIADYKKEAKTILMFDNYWEGTLRQKVGQYLLKLKVVPLFDYCWIPGEIHKEYAYRMGFTEEQIFLGFYATNLDRFLRVHNLSKKREHYPKKFVYVGRYLTLKGIEDLWEAFIQFSKKNDEWELHCIGMGELYDKRVKHPKIIHHGFVQQKDLPKMLSRFGVFILPSHYDHWGMAVQEAAATGLPLICSDTVGAVSSFLKDNVNGFIFKSKDINDLEEKMNKIASMNNLELIKFSEKSYMMSQLYTEKTWSRTLQQIVIK